MSHGRAKCQDFVNTKFGLGGREDLLAAGGWNYTAI